jgi:hypothetical protein
MKHLEEASLKPGNQNSARTFQELNDLILTTRSALKQYESACKEKRLEITKLQIQKIRAETLVEDFQNNNEKYLQMKQTVKTEVESTFANRRLTFSASSLCLLLYLVHLIFP